MTGRMYLIKSCTMWTFEHTFLDLDCWDNPAHCDIAKQLVRKPEHETNGQPRTERDEEAMKVNSGGCVEGDRGIVEIDDDSEECHYSPMVDKEPFVDISITAVGKPNHRCQVCQKEFSWPSHLVAHQRTHTGDKPFQCSVCEKKFAQKQNLTTHMRQHTGDKPFNCKMCGKSFTTSTHLKRHHLIHTGEKPFSCSYCEAKFTQRSHLKDHERTHTEERPYSCSFCQARFKQSSTLKKHEEMHRGYKKHT